MALELSIYNMQKRTSGAGKDYNARVCVFTPGQSGRLSEDDQRPPFYIRDQRGDQQWVRLEARTITEAKAEAQKAQDTMEATAKGVQVVPLAGEKNSLRAVIETYLREVESNKSVATWKGYSRSLELFQGSCRKLNVESVERTDLLAFKTYMKRSGKFSGRTIYNCFLNTMIFFKWCKDDASPKIAVNFELGKNDWPPKPERDPEAYDHEEIKLLMENTNEEGRLLLKAFLFSGLRDGEISHLTYGDIDGRHSIWRVRPKTGHDLKTEDSQRDVPVAESLTKKIMDRKKALGKTDGDLVFPTRMGKVNEHLIRVVQRAAKKAEIEGRVDNHKFRSTAITIWLRNGCTVPDVMRWVGHRKPETILRYAAMVQLQDEDARRKITKPFEQFASMGD